MRFIFYAAPYYAANAHVSWAYDRSADRYIAAGLDSIMALASQATSVASNMYIPRAITSLLAQHAIASDHVALLLNNAHVMRALRHFDQVRRDASANPGNDMTMTIQRVNTAQQMVVAWIHAAWATEPEAQSGLEDAEVQLAIIDALLCTQP